MRHALMVSGSYPCVRAGKLTEAMNENGWTHSAVCCGYPPQMTECYTSITALHNSSRRQLAEMVMATEGEVVHVHNEPNWPVVELKRRGETRPIVMNVHDVSSARPFHPGDANRILEAEAYAAADAFVFISKEQRDFAIACGFDIEGKPYALLPNYASHTTIVAKPLLPHIGGVVYAGGLDPRGMEGAWRDLSGVDDALDGKLHIYPGGMGVDYGIVYPTVLDYRLLTHRLSQHDWGFSGTPVPNHAWGHSYPNKVFEYFAAGIPIIALNNPLLVEFCDDGLGFYLDRISDIRRIKAVPKAMKKRVKEVRERYTFLARVQPVLDLYEEVLDAHGRDKQLQPVGVPEARDSVGSVRDAIGIRL